MTELERHGEGWLRLHHGERPQRYALHWCDERSGGTRWAVPGRRGRRIHPKIRLQTLVWYKGFGDIELAIRREKQMKEWKRLWKLRAIEEMNPEWNDLFESLL